MTTHTQTHTSAECLFCYQGFGILRAPFMLCRKNPLCRSKEFHLSGKCSACAFVLHENIRGKKGLAKIEKIPTHTRNIQGVLILGLGCSWQLVISNSPRAQTNAMLPSEHKLQTEETVEEPQLCEYRHPILEFRTISDLFFSPFSRPAHTMVKAYANTHISISFSVNTIRSSCRTGRRCWATWAHKRQYQQPRVAWRRTNCRHKIDRAFWPCYPCNKCRNSLPIRSATNDRFAVDAPIGPNCVSWRYSDVATRVLPFYTQYALDNIVA